ncbi:unnamed protein product [Aphanomyces euteiches]|uniref:Amino acid permease/ SLC12A domain-containing protein n=1 Tax=Aphanomyces euteiches TaxID=100861 RepID=A0A6G0W6S6_9STRA|nr:hypothetical protein Ae201684_018148 [Aphanomyces euteiches]KAH9073992.1 hypothetical protein Ae201684P_015891 [Aphanomyces euteiches]KAH9153698.1 hypothetical protein AeRB84_004093 [Aphanomyces euteiches]
MKIGVLSKANSVHPLTSSKSGPTSPVSGCAVVNIEKADVHPEDLASVQHIWALGVVAVIGGQFYGWNVSFSAGFVPFFCAQLMMGTAYIVYIACVSEVSGKVPGGSYGLARAVLGFYPGFILGCLEILEYTSFAAVSVLYVAGFATDYFEWDPDFQPLIWFLFYAFFIALLESKGKYVWWFMLLFVIPSLLPTILYVFSSIPYWDLRTNGALIDPDTNDTTWATGDIGSAFFALLPSTTVGYGGIESLTVATGFAKDPGYSVPKGTVAAVWTLFVSNIALVLVAAALPPGLEETSTYDYFLDQGLNLGLGFSPQLSEWLMIPAQMGMAFGFFIPYARLTQAMADSNLLPSMFGIKGQKTTKRAMIMSSLFGYFLCVVSYLSPKFQATLQNISIVAASICYASQTYGFVLLRTTYRIDTTGYKSPYGIAGAYYVWFVSLCLFLSIAGGFQGDDGIAIVSTIVFLVVMTVYYRFGCLDSQTVSQEEYASIFKFSVMKFNKLRQKKKSNNRSSNGGTSQMSRLSIISMAKKVQVSIRHQKRGSNPNK